MATSPAAAVEPAVFTSEPRYIRRFSRTERTLHWVHAAAFFVYPLVLILLTVSAVVSEPFVAGDPALRSRIFTAHILLTTVGGYPVSMVGVPGERVSNMSPPTAALLACAVWLIGLAVLVRGPVTRWLDRPAVWRGVVTANGLAMTTFLWHLTAMFLASAATLALGVAQPPVGSAMWWLYRPVWIAALLVPTVILVTLFRRADRPRPARVSDRPAAARTTLAALGVALCTVGVLGFSAVGFGGVLAGRSATLVVLPVTPLLSVALLAGGAGLLRFTRPMR